MLRTQFTPRNYAGLQLWLDAADTATLFDATSGGSLPANNGGVARWVDKGPNAFAFTQGTANNRPQRKTQQLNGLDGIYFDGSNDCLYSAANVFDTTVSVLCVAAFDNNTSRRVVADFNTASTGSFHLAFEQNTFATVGSRYGFFAPNSNTFDSDLATSSGAKLFCATADATSGGSITSNTTYRINGVTRTLTSKNGSGNFASSTTTEGVMIGAFNNAGANLAPTIGMLGHIYEVMAYNVRLSTDQIGVIERYLASKWNITL
jgi:hypothetical protein